MKKLSVPKIIFMCIFALIGIICILYGLKVHSAGYGSAFFAVWIALGIFFIFCTWAVWFGLWMRLPKWFRIAFIALCAVCLGFFTVIEACIASRINSEGEDNLDYIIVLGAMVKEDGPSSILKARLNSAIRYLEANPDTKCIVSGGQGYDEPYSEAEGMRRYLTENGIDESRIIMEPDSMNTIQNIRNSKAIIDDDNAKVGIVTSKFHVYRAVKIAEKQGFKNVCGISAYVVPSYMPSNMFREFFGVVKDTLQGNM